MPLVTSKHPEVQSFQLAPLEQAPVSPTSKAPAAPAARASSGTPARSSGSAAMQQDLISRTAAGPAETAVPVGTNAITHHPDQVEAEIFTPGALASAASQASSTAVSAARSAFHGAMRAKGCTLDELTTAATALGGKYVRSHSAGAKLFSLNDHAGVLVVPFPNRGMTITEHLAVVKDTLPGANGTPQPCYLVKGYGSRLVGVDEALTGFSAQAHDSKPDAQRMETSFRTHLLELSKAAPLAARRSVHESNRPVMPVPPNAMEMPRRNVWANAENYMSKGCGGRPINSAGVPSDFDALHLDFNPIEGRILIFMPGPEQHDKVHPTQVRNGKTVPASVNIEGSVLAELQGILSVEVMGPRGTPGVKLAGLHNLRGMLHKGATDGHLHLRIATEDGAIHELKQNPNGLKMRLVAPKEPGVDLLAPLDTAQTSLYTYQGRDTGLYGSIAGHANPQLVLSTGEALLAGPLMIDRASMKGQLRAAAKMTAGVMLLQPTLGARDSRLAAPLRTLLVAAATTAMVVGMAAMINALRDPKTHTLLAGARPFSTAGAGLVSLPKLAGAIAVMVLAQNSLSWVFDKLYDHGMKDVWKSKETASLQFVNELLLPMTGEFLRLAVNYGTQKGMGLPRGDAIDVTTLLGVAGMLTVSRAVIGRSGQPENHPVAKVVAHTVDFFIGDLMFRALGAVAGNKDLRADLRPIDYAEAFLTRLGTRTLDKWVAPLVATGLSAAGLLGSNATAYDDQISREARVSGLVMALQDLVTHFSLVGDKLLLKGERAIADDIEILAAGIKGTANLIESSHKAWNRVGINPLDANPLELQRVQNAVAFPDMSEDQQAEHLQSMTAQFEAMIEATRLPDEGEGAPSSGPAPATAAAAPAADRHSPAVTAVANSISQLPEAMKPLISELMTSFADKYDPEGGSRYPTMVAPDLLSVSLPHDAVANERMGGKTNRVLRDMTTFSGAPAEHIKKVHDAMASASGMPEEVRHSRKPYKELTPASLRAIETATVKYTQESGFFHYLLRWSQTGQSHFTEVVPGVHIETEMMNKRGNINGDIDRQISPADPLWINLGAVHADKFNALVQRAVVTDVPYYDAAPVDGGVKPITEGQRISLTEILSTTSAETLAAAFLAALGYGATGNERNLRIVLKQDTAVNIAKHTELMQAETISMPGGIFVIDRVDAHPPQQTNADGSPAANLGQVVYMRRLNTYELENNFRSWEQAAARGAKPTLADGAVCIHPTTGHFHKYDAGSGTVEFVKASRNYFHGADIEADPSQPARWRNPYTSPSSPRGMLDFINAALLLNDPIKPFLNDATRNIHHEEDMQNGGYYAEGDPVRAADQIGLAEMRQGADVALAALDGLRHNKPFPAHDPDAGLNPPVAVRDLMVSVIAGALRKPLKLIEIGADGSPALEDGKPKVVGDFTRTWDGVEMKFDKPGPTMVGVGPDGFHAMGYHDGVLTCAPVRIDGDGATPGNLLHAILAPADTGGQRYSFAAGAVRSADAGMARLATRRDAVRDTSRQLFDKLIHFAHADYVPLQSWLSTQAGGRPYARPAA